MPRIMYVDGKFAPEDEAVVPVMDRSFLFGDGIYEVTAVIKGRLIDNEPHLRRLDRSLREIEIPNPHSLDEWVAIQTDLIARNHLREGLVYIQVSRGVFERDYLSPENLRPTVIMFTQEKSLIESPLSKTGAAIVTVPDLRWERRDVKSVSLLAQVLAKRAARAAGANEAWMVEDGFVTEGASSTAFIITKAGVVVTRPLSHAVLPGITRRAVLMLVESERLSFEERAFSVEEIEACDEAFYTSAGSFVMPVVAMNGKPVGGGRPGPMAERLRGHYLTVFDT